MSDKIEKILRDADAAADPPQIRENLAGRVRQRDRAQRLRHRAVVATVLCLGIAAGWLIAHRPERATVALDAAEARRRIAILEDEAKWRSGLAERLWQRERERRQTATRGPRFLVEPPDAAIDRAAFAMVYQADRMARDPALRDAAQQAYRNVAADFPNTPSAAVARQRLGERKDG